MAQALTAYRSHVDLVHILSRIPLMIADTIFDRLDTSYPIHNLHGTQLPAKL